jgi:rifampin ADP-ribosylating transferase
MLFDTENEIVKLCGQGMMLEGEGNEIEARKLIQQAWDRASSDFEKFTAAHYVARHQESVPEKLEWDKAALHFALKVNDEEIKGVLPSLYLNVGKCYEDLKDFNTAAENYQLALSFSIYLPDDGYGRMIKAGIVKGIERVVG